MIGFYQNIHDDSIIEIYLEVCKRQTNLKARWIKAKTKEEEFYITENFNKFKTFIPIKNDN